MFTPMRVLFLGADGVSAPVRILPLLQSLMASGDIDFATVDRRLAVSGSGASPFDVVLAHRNLSKRQMAWLQRSGQPFAYDVDDLILRTPGPLGGRQAREQEAIRWCLTNAACVTSPSRRLLATLEQRLGQPLAARSVFLANGALASEVTPTTKTKPHLLWVSSHGQNYDELHDIAIGVAGAARALKTDVTLVGRFPESVRAAIPGHRHVPWIEPQEYRRFLANGSFIAASPLPISLAPDEQEFVNCKSDIKAAEYISLGIAALYSAAPPYADSDLPCVIAPTNSAADWESGLVALAQKFPREGVELARHPSLAGRQRPVLARALLAVLQRVQAATKAPLDFSAIPTPAIFSQIEQGIRSVRNRLIGRRG